MAILDENKCLMLIIDIQEKLLNAVFNKDLIKNKSVILAKSAKILNIPVIVTEQYPKGLGSTIPELKSALRSDTNFFEKTSFSAFSDEAIKNAIIKTEKKQILVCGIETHICVSQTVNALSEYGFDVSFIKDASGSRNQEEHKSGIERIVENGASVLTTEIALFELLKSSNHEKFKEIQNLIK